MAAELDYLSPKEAAQSIRSTQLEQAYERALRQVERIYDEERARALRVQFLLLEDENDELQEQISENDNDLEKLEDVNDELRLQLAEVEADLQQAHTDLKARMRDLDHYKTEVNALNESSSDATKILSEKLSLARQLATLKPELEHLRSQAVTQQNLLAEKLALQRELSAIQVELETEKRAVQRIISNDKASTTSSDPGLIGEIEELKKELAKAQRDAQKNDRENRKRMTDWESQKEVLDGKLDAFRNRLRSTKEQLKDAQDELEKVQAAKMAQSAELTKARLTGANPKKRNIARFDPDMTIGTPGNGGPAKKQRTSVNFGDKSTFSMTPFLSRTMSILPESPEDTQEAHDKADEFINKQINAIVDETEMEVEPRPAQTKPATKKPAISKPKTIQPLRETTNSKANTVAQKPRLAKVAEEELEEQGQENAESSEHAEHTTAEPVKKQKVLNKRPNIFDEADNVGAAKAKSLTATSLRGGGTAFGVGKINLAGLGKGRGKKLAEFSPLKKDRRVAAGGLEAQ